MSPPVLSLRQPWAWMVVHGGKNIENRRWSTKRRGDFLVHAAKGMTRAEYEDAVLFARIVDAELVVPPRADLAFGGIIGRARIVDVLPPCVEGKCDHLWHMPKQYGFVLADAEPLTFRPLVGKLGFFALCGTKCFVCDGRGWHIGECHPREECGACDGTGVRREPTALPITIPGSPER